LKRFSPVSQGQSQNLRRRLGLPTDKTIVLTVQRLHERKGVHVYLEAAALALKRHPELVFVVVGGGPESEKLKALASRLGISSGVLFTGKVSDEDLPGYYQSADLFAFHSFHEGFGIVLLEAMACGRPIITTEAGGTKDIAVPGPGGRMVKPGDAGAFAQAIFDILKDRQAWAHMGEFNRRRTEEVYDWDKIAKQYLTLYERILEPAAA
jgi:glycosyltransferase involved in cell wall biosynthesis